MGLRRVIRWFRRFTTLGWYLDQQEAKARWKELVEQR